MTGGLGQRCVAGVVMQADGFEGYRGYYKQEVPYLNRAPVMSRNEPVRLTLKGNTTSRGGQVTFLSLNLPVATSPATDASPDPSMPGILVIPEPPAVRLPRD